MEHIGRVKFVVPYNSPEVLSTCTQGRGKE